MGFTKLVRSGDLVEVYQYENNLPDRKRKSKENTGGYRTSTERRADNVRRCGKAFTRLVRANLVGDEKPAFFTFTMFEVVRIDVAFRCYTDFVERLRRAYGKSIRYVAVPEFQERGAVHFHALFWGFSDKVLLNEGSRGKTAKQKHIWAEWLNAKGYVKSDLGDSRSIQHLWARGFVDCIPTDGSSKLASYLSKYMFKTMFDDRLLAQKAYVASRNVLRPVQSTFNEAFGFLQCLVGDTVPERKAVWEAPYLGSCRYTRYVVDIGNERRSI